MGRGNTKVELVVEIEQPSEKKFETYNPTLLDKVKYAIDCMEADYNTKKATKFMVDVYQRLCQTCAAETMGPEKAKIMRMIIPFLELHYPEVLVSTHYMQFKQTRTQEERPANAEDY